MARKQRNTIDILGAKARSFKGDVARGTQRVSAAVRGQAANTVRGAERVANAGRKIKADTIRGAQLVAKDTMAAPGVVATNARKGLGVVASAAGERLSNMGEGLKRDKPPARRPSQPQTKGPKTRNRSEAARKAAITRKAKGK